MLHQSPEAYDLIKNLRVVRRYEARSLSDSDERAILEAGRWTGSSKNTQNWRFVVVRDAETKARLAECGAFAGLLAGAATVIVPVQLPDGYEFDIGRVSQNMMLAAAALGVGSCPTTMYELDKVREILGVPEDHVPRYALAFGYPDVSGEQVARKGAKAAGLSGRLPFDEVVMIGKFRD
ncbi:MAG: nitroreductase family protein [Acidimicrobiia bacterium]|nr:nitroreductase family protein [Acidimicrobiia bacterium]